METLRPRLAPAAAPTGPRRGGPGSSIHERLGPRAAPAALPAPPGAGSGQARLRGAPARNGPGELPASGQCQHSVMDVQVVDSLGSIPAAQWDALIGTEQPFLSHAFLHGLESHDCIGPQSGWIPHHLVLYDGARL